MPTLRFIGLVLLALSLCKSPAAAFDLLATHQVTVQFATQDGKPMADAEVSVFAPGDLTHPVKTGRTDKDGKFEFGTDRDGLWTAEARNGTEVARATIKVGGSGGEKQGGEPSPYLVVGALGVLLVIAVWYRFLRTRARRRRG
jgi:nickel transport protein